jgi:hypothetical protein
MGTQSPRVPPCIEAAESPTMHTRPSLIAWSARCQPVHLSPAVGRNVPGGSYQVVKQLPASGGELEYRIKSMNEPHERVARESELRKA